MMSCHDCGMLWEIKCICVRPQPVESDFLLRAVVLSSLSAGC